ncbi:MAG: hypothetical protein FWE12_08440, partial [Oscillospiraceae bacterium]|nr:hypothetical protein [Oscillospiraceae bacterium]
LEATATELNAKIAQEELKAPKITREFIDFFFDKYRQMDLDSWESQQRLVDGLVNAIVVHDDKILVTYNYKEGTETIPLSELDGSDLALVGEPDKTNPNTSLRACSDLLFLLSERYRRGPRTVSRRGPLRYISSTRQWEANREEAGWKFGEKCDKVNKLSS